MHSSSERHKLGCSSIMFATDATPPIHTPMSRGNGYGIGGPTRQMHPEPQSADCEHDVRAQAPASLSFPANTTKIQI